MYEDKFSDIAAHMIYKMYYYLSLAESCFQPSKYILAKLFKTSLA